MGLRLTCRINDASWHLQLGLVDLELLHAAADSCGVRAEVDTVLGTGEWGVPAPVPRTRLLQAVERLLTILGDPDSPLPFVYRFTARCTPLSNTEYNELTSGSGSFSGFRIGGELHSIDTGVGRCTLSRVRVNAQGLGEIVEARDVRALKRIETDDFGPITISRRRCKEGVVAGLADLRDFLRARAEDTVERTLG